MSDIAGARGGVPDFRMRAGQFADGGGELVDADGFAAGHIEDARGVGLRGQKILAAATVCTATNPGSVPRRRKS